MLGNLFGQRKSDHEGQTSTAPPAANLPPIQGASVSPAPMSSGPAIANQTSLPASPGQNSGVVGSSMEPGRRQDLSALSHLDSRSSQVLAHAKEEVKRIKQALIEPTQLLEGLLFDQDIYKLLEQFSVDVAKLSGELKSKEQVGTFLGEPTLSDASKQIVEQAYRDAKVRGVDFITPEDILLCLFSQNADASQTLKAQGLKKEQLEEQLAKSGGFTTSKKSVLQKFGIDLTEQARAGKLDPIAGRDEEIDRMVHILLRRTKNNPIIIGDAGVGKTAIVEGLAEKIVEGTAPSGLSQKHIVQLDVSSLVAGASHRGEFEERLRSVIQETLAMSGQIILFIDEIHTLMGTGAEEGSLDASNIIKPHLARGQLQIIGTTTTTEYRKYFEKDKAFARRFQPIVAQEPSEEKAIKMLEVLKPKYEKFHKVVIPQEALEAAVHLSKKYIGERFLPDKAVDLLDEASADVKLQDSSGKRQDNTVQKTDIEKVVSTWTGIPITKLTEDESAKLLHLEDLIHKRLIDQEEAVVAVAEAVRRGRIGLASGQRPIASFMFLGPTGTGKTELAKTLAEILFGRDDAMIRLDMSEYMEKHEVAKLIGAPPGYVGYEEGGQLTEAVRAKPYSIVLLDEVEKAHPDVFNILLQVLEDGRLTDNKGNTISFKNTVIIATSNIGSAMIQQALSGKDTATLNPEQFDKKFAEISEMVSEELHKFFRPELLNRFDEIVIFKPLSAKDMTYIAKLGIAKTEKLLLEQGFKMQVQENALVQLAKEGYDPLYGARPLRRLIQTAIENPIALLVIGKTFVPGDTIVINFDATKNEFTFTKGAAVGQAQPGQQPTQASPSQTPANPLPNQSAQPQPIIPQPPVSPPPPPSNPGQPAVSAAAQ